MCTTLNFPSLSRFLSPLSFSLSLSFASSFFRKLFYVVPSVGLFFWPPSNAYILHNVQSYKVEHGILSTIYYVLCVYLEVTVHILLLLLLFYYPPSSGIAPCVGIAGTVHDSYTWHGPA